MQITFIITASHEERSFSRFNLLSSRTVNLNNDAFIPLKISGPRIIVPFIRLPFVAFEIRPLGYSREQGALTLEDGMVKAALAGTSSGQAQYPAYYGG
jgi:hypothetical protein